MGGLTHVPLHWGRSSRVAAQAPARGPTLGGQGLGAPPGAPGPIPSALAVPRQRNPLQKWHGVAVHGPTVLSTVGFAGVRNCENIGLQSGVLGPSTARGVVHLRSLRVYRPNLSCEYITEKRVVSQYLACMLHRV
eukprot:2080918-Amphidinium_carterae.1